MEFFVHRILNVHAEVRQFLYKVVTPATFRSLLLRDLLPLSTMKGPFRGHSVSFQSFFA